MGTIINPASVFHCQVAAFRRKLLTQALREHGQNRAAAARALGLTRTYFVRLLRHHDVPRARRKAFGR